MNIFRIFRTKTLIRDTILCFVLSGLSSKLQQMPGSQQLDDFMTQRLEEKLRAARVRTLFLLGQSRRCNPLNGTPHSMFLSL